MFTGLVEACGEIKSKTFDGPSMWLDIRVPDEVRNDPNRPNCMVGDSVAINGCCLTVVEIYDDRWSFQLGAETLAKTNLKSVKIWDKVNLERPLQTGAELGGHFVQGHVDGIATVDAIDKDGDWVTMWFKLAPEWMRLLVPKGSVAVDGISLTVVDVEADRFSVALIPHTLQVTTLGVRKTGDSVNIETDILAKHVDRLLALRQEHVY